MRSNYSFRPIVSGLGFLKSKVKKAFYALSVWGRFALGLACVAAVLAFCNFLTPKKGHILPVGNDIVEGYRLLASTPTGRDLIKRASMAAAGSYVYLTAGETETDRLRYYDGEPVRALTRAVTQIGTRRCTVIRATVITNNELVGNQPREIAKSLAWELENVCHLYGASCACPQWDTPRAPITQRRVAAELGG